MKKKYITSFMMLMTCLIFLTLQAQAFVTPYDPYSGFLPRKMPVVKRHLRGVWITTVQNLDWPSVQAVSIKNDKERIKTCKEELIAFLDRAVSMNMNAVFFQVSPEADAFYRSELVPWSRYLTGTFGKDPGFDPLEFIIEQAHQRNLEFHAWFNPYRVSVSTSSQTRDSLSIKKSVFREHSAWIKTASNRYVVDPGFPDARKWIIKRVMEVVRKYDIDGVHFDDYFYYESTSSKLNDRRTFETYNKGQFTDIGDWRRNNTYLLVKELSEEIRAEKSWVKFGISPSGVWRNKSEHPEGSNSENSYTNYDSSFADTKKWVEEELIDYIAPQIYYSFANPRASYGEVANWWAEVVQDKDVHLYIGQALYKINDDSDTWFKGANAVRELENQLKMNSCHDLISGTIMFRARNMNDDRKQQAIGNALDYIWNSKALIPVMPWKGGHAPQKPVPGWMEPVSDGIRITWSDSDANTAYYAIYRFEEGEKVNTNIHEIASNLIATVRKGTGEVQEYLDPQEQPGKVGYLVTALDRLHHESEGAVIKSSLSAFFHDIGPDYEWAKASIDGLYEKKIVYGDGNGFFYPAENTKRGDFVLMLIRAFGLKAETVENYMDVPADSYYHKDIAVAKALGILQENKNYFYPDSYITREDLMVMLLRAMAITGHEVELAGEEILNQYEDSAAISNYARPAAACLVKSGIINGINGSIAPKNFATRAEIIVILHRALNWINN
ncbi:MAG: family 10 glycosylhydrolase [Clostridiaceae bacterium]|nr:family 10 glycosylhydrolase [Clostridiaceae bacterium]